MYPHCSRCWGHSSDQSKDPVFMELMFNKGLDGGSVLWTGRVTVCVVAGDGMLLFMLAKASLRR